jgi:RNA polymerase sigma-70 factor, ECF subfamily
MLEHDPRRERFEALFRRYHPAVRNFARRRVPTEAVDDIVSETFLVAWRRFEQVPEEPLPWLLRVARNTVGTERRGAARRRRLWIKAQSGYVEAANEPEFDVGDGRILRALAALGDRDREALTLVAWDGLKPSEAAQVLDEPAARFRVRLHRASRRLRAELVSNVEPRPLPSKPDAKPMCKGARV